MAFVLRTAWFLAYCAVVVAGNLPTLRALFEFSNQNATASYVLLIPLVTLALVYQERDTIFSNVRIDWPAALPFIVAGAALMVAGFLGPPSMAADLTYDYAIVRVVPRVERGEQVNVGVILSCADTDFLDARIEMDEGVLRALDPAIDLALVRTNLDVIPAVCRGGPEAGPIGLLRARERFPGNRGSVASTGIRNGLCWREGPPSRTGVDTEAGLKPSGTSFSFQ